MEELRNCKSLDGAIMRANSRRKKHKDKKKKTIRARLKSTIEEVKKKFAENTAGKA